MRYNNKIKTVFLALCLSLLPLMSISVPGNLIVSEAHAAVVSRIDVRGNQRIDDEVVASYLTIVPGQSFNNFDIDDSIKALFVTGLFSDVSIFQEGATLVVEVDENATVNKVFFEGNKRIKDDALTGVVILKSQSVYSDEQAATDVDRINLAYSRVGRRDATVSFEVVPLANNRVNVIYRINEGEKTKISQINFIGNDTFSGRRLADVISTKESGLLSFLSTNDIFDRNRLNADEELLRNFYFNRGFADFQIVSTDAQLDEVENEYIITITMEEGPRYTFGNISVESTISGVSGEELLPLLETDAGEFYSARRVENSILAITNAVAEQGFAFVEVAPRGNRNFENNTIDVVYLVDEGARVFIEDIRIIGNSRTRDYVIRREFELSEGDAYNRVLIQKTRDRIQGLGFFTNVEVTTRPGSSADKIIVFVNVTEQSTGDISLSGGFSSNGGASAQVSVSERNFLGRGQFIRAAVRGSEDETGYNFDFTEPYFLGYPVSAGISLEAVESDDTDERRFDVDSNRATITFGVPITERLRSSVFYTYSSSDVSANAGILDTVIADGIGAPDDAVQGNGPAELSNAFVSTGLGEFISSGLGYSLVYSSLDNAQTPREGIRANWSQTFFGVGGDANYLSTNASLVSYTTLLEEQDLIFMARVRGGHVEIFGGDDGTNFRVFDNFQARQNTIRGFDSFGYGPRDPITGDALGGQTFWNATAEVQFPLPFVSRSFGLRGAVFADVGQLTTPGNAAIAAVIASNPGLTPAQLAQLDDDAVRASVGGSILWASPFGPLRVDYAVPISEEVFDERREFNFGVSSQF